MRKSIFPILAFIASALVPAFINTSLAWDAVGHRITASIAYQFSNDETRSKLFRIIESHPRF
jgi:hypothetical protein